MNTAWVDDVPQDTFLIFLSDNGANHERGIFGDNAAAPLTGAALANMGQPGQNDAIRKN